MPKGKDKVKNNKGKIGYKTRKLYTLPKKCQNIIAIKMFDGVGTPGKFLRIYFLTNEPKIA